MCMDERIYKQQNAKKSQRIDRTIRGKLNREDENRHAVNDFVRIEWVFWRQHHTAVSHATFQLWIVFCFCWSYIVLHFDEDFHRMNTKTLLFIRWFYVSPDWHFVCTCYILMSMNFPTPNFSFLIQCFSSCILNKSFTTLKTWAKLKNLLGM